MDEEERRERRVKRISLILAALIVGIPAAVILFVELMGTFR